MHNLTKNITSLAKKSALVLALASSFATPAFAAGGAISGGPEFKHVDWSWAGVFGTFDRAQLQRGYQVYKEVCASCHAMELVKFRNLSEAGGPEFSKAQVKVLAAEYEIEDGPDAEGEMFMRSRKPKDALPSPFANDNAAKASNGGALPPDLSLIAKSRGHFSFKDMFMGRDGLSGGPNYIYNLLVGYEDEVPEYITKYYDHKNEEGLKADPDYTESHFELGDSNFNNFFPGYKLAMAMPLDDDSVEYSDGTKATLAQQAEDVSTFLMWAAEPKMEIRKSIGIRVLLFLIILAGLMYAVKRRIWENVRH